ncbi:MAG: PEP-CTERM sorting domain-containing protein [Bythopirellula sp.]
MSMHQRNFSTRAAGRLEAFLALASLTMLTTTVVANEQRITIQVPGNSTPAPNWAFGLSIRGNPTAGGSTTTAVPAGTSSAGVATAVANAITNQMGINATTNGNTLIISQHNQPEGFDFDPLAPGTKFGTSFGGLSGPGGTNGPWGVSRAFRVWAPAPPPPPAPIQLAQRVFQVMLPPDPLGMPGVMNQLEINLLDDHDELLFGQILPIPDIVTQQELDQMLMQAFQELPPGLGGWMMLPQPEGVFFGNSMNQWMTGGGIEVLLHPGSDEAQMQLILEGEELLYEYDSYADFNVDGIVGEEDMAIWKGNYGLTGVAFGDGDANFDTFVGGPDFLAVQRHYGEDLSGGSAATAVPEPGTLLLAMAGTLAVSGVRRKGRKD